VGWTTVTLVLGLAFLAELGVLSILTLRRPGARVGAVGQFGHFVRVGLEVSSEVKGQVTRHLEDAASRRHQLQDVPVASQQLQKTSLIRAARILWVDDHPDWNIAEHLMLRDLGLSMTQATTTEAAEEYLSLGSFDLVITDLTRGEDREAGLALVEMVRAKGTRIPIIVYTMQPGPRKARALELGARAVTTTPGELLVAVLGAVARESKS
jgi:CheY-like chemotaxis protein